MPKQLGVDVESTVLRKYEAVRRRYVHLNTQYKSAAKIAVPGAFIKGMVASHTARRVVLQLNCGRSGVVVDPSVLHQFRGLPYGSVVDLRVCAVSADGATVFVDRQAESTDRPDL